MKITDCPRHVSIIMDGNGRWAAERGRSRSFGHRQGAKVVRDIVAAAPGLGIETLTLYAFSTENWKRPKYEVQVLMRLFRTELLHQADALDAQDVRIKFIGARSGLPAGLVRIMQDVETRTKGNQGLTLQLAINYGGRAELLEAMQRLGRDALSGQIDLGQLSENDISDRLGTAGTADPDLIIRTSGEKRLSNFLLWQAAYSELAFVDLHWPDFTKETLAELLQTYALRDRRFGAIA